MKSNYRFGPHHPFGVALAAGLPLLASALVAGCSSHAESTDPAWSNSQPAGTSNAAILGGFPASSPKLDAVGDIAEVLNIADDGTLTMDAKCSGVLIGPHTVLTASHCATKYGNRNSFVYTEVYFRVGATSATPREQVRIAGYAISPDVTGGNAGYGSDIAVFQLADDITDVTPMPIGAAPTAAEIGKTFLAVGYGRQSRTEAAGTFDTRSMGPMLLTSLQGNPLQALWPTLGAMMAAADQYDPTITASELGPYYNSSAEDLAAGEEAFFSGVNDNGVIIAAGDSGSPILRLTGGGFEIAGIASSVPVGFDGLPFAGSVYGLPNTADNTTFIQAQLADPTRAVPNAGYCNGTSAVQSVTASQGTNPISILECLSLGMTCGIVDSDATCVDPVTSGPASTCSVAGNTYALAAVGSRSYVAQFNVATGDAGATTDDAGSAEDPTATWSINGSVFGTYELANGMLTLTDAHDACSDPGSYVATFAPDCSSFTIGLALDSCELRAESFDAATFTLQP